MNCTLMPGIEDISGSWKMKNGTRLVFMTRKAPTTNKQNRTRVYFRTEDSYQRKTPLTQKEIAARDLFQRRQTYVQQLLANGTCKTRAEAWIIAKTDIK